MVIVGDGECGKTCLVTRMSTGNFVDIGYIPTVFETELVSVNTGKENVELIMFDTAGQEDYDRLRPFSYTDVDVVLICFSLAEQNTLTNVVENWSPEIRYFCGDVPVILVGNKKDLRDAESSLSSSSKGSLSASSSSGETAAVSEGKTNRDQSASDTHTTAKSHSVTLRSSEDPAEILVADINTDSMRDCSINERPRSSLYSYSSKCEFHASAPVKHSEGVQIARRIGAMAYFETSALTGDNVEELLLATTKAAVLGTKKSKKFKPFTNTMASWKSLGALSPK
ncbi:GTP-binding protein rhoA [Elysia marginata]|uniref:GTP-binding protein rhoA n=1 Tax=Elysia marginata TaxID=1093978 RepID=A0AAV4HJM7_9GAST|nr:GTP-binding protein rhoA [Elysia marginata]